MLTFDSREKEIFFPVSALVHAHPAFFRIPPPEPLLTGAAVLTAGLEGCRLLEKERELRTVLRAVGEARLEGESGRGEEESVPEAGKGDLGAALGMVGDVMVGTVRVNLGRRASILALLVISVV